jgi:hypothetical protein
VEKTLKNKRSGEKCCLISVSSMLFCKKGGNSDHLDSILDTSSTIQILILLSPFWTCSWLLKMKFLGMLVCTSLVTLTTEAELQMTTIESLWSPTLRSTVNKSL